MLDGLGRRPRSAEREAELAQLSSSITGLVAHPREVKVEEEGEAPEEAVLELARSGRLKATDLVDDGSGWREARECPALFDHFTEEDEAASGSRTVAIVLVVIVAAVLMLVFVVS